MSGRFSDAVPVAAPSPTPRRARRVLLDALIRNDLDAADAALEALGDALPGDLVEPVAMLHLSRRRWAQATALLRDLRDPDPRAAALRRYAANMGALQTHRPAVYALVVNAPNTGRYEIIGGRGGVATVARVEPGDRLRPLSPGGDPTENVRRARAAVAPLGAKGSAVGVLGICDGHVLATLAAEPPKTVLGNPQAVHVVEPDPELVRACLMLHDFAGDGGPIAQRRFIWHVGPKWRDGFARLLDDEPQTPEPVTLLRQTPQADAMIEELQSVLLEVRRRDEAVTLALQTHYAGRTAADFARAIRGEAGRPPRVLFITSRWTTVLQYATRDAAEAMARLGWETRVVIEHEPHLQLTVPSVRREIEAHPPDLVVVIDHLRSEYGDLIPPNVPYVCWIQDNLSNLTNEQAGRSVGPRDFVIGAWVRNYVRDHAYPAAQCITVPRLTAARAATPLAEPVGDDLMYVSTHAETPEARLEAVAAALAADPRVERLAREAGAAMLAHYAAGGALHEAREVEAMTARVAASLQWPSGPEAAAALRAVAWQLFDRVNNALYRQQALAWAADAAERLGLTLAIYGPGWESHPTLAKYARGPISYGEPLAEATRRARFSLMLEPYFATSHQRVLDGWIAGGFFLLRRRPIDVLQAEWMACIEALPAEVGSVAAARAALTGEPLQRFEELQATMHALHPGEPELDLVALHRERQRQGMGFLMASPPGYEDVAFDDAAGLARLIERYAIDPAARARIAAAQQAFAAGHFTYDAGLRRVTQQIAAALDAEGRDLVLPRVA